MTITKKNREEESLQERLIEEILKDASKELIKKETLPREEDCDYEPSKKFKKSMERILKSAERKAWWQGNYITVAKGAASVMIVGTVASATVMNVEAFKVPIFNFFMENQEKYSKLEVKEEGKEEEAEYDYSRLLKEYPGIALPMKMPEEYQYQTTKGSEEKYTTIYLNNNNNGMVVLSQVSRNSAWDVDTERSPSKEIEKDNIKYKVFLDGENTTVVWNMGENSYNLNGQLTEQEIEKIIENMYYPKEK
ncbi:MAG TPA: DUF4367 domain-containing protein [Candidatus Scybalomonas excrementigallinarum]|nr:DUF4367 domain-containing protein [Candidatus Scybalomonas excrementigallinarum]